MRDYGERLQQVLEVYANVLSERECVFPADKVAVDPADGKTRRYHVYEEYLQAVVKRACHPAHAPPQAAAALPEGRCPLGRLSRLNRLRLAPPADERYAHREIRQLLGHKSAETTMMLALRSGCASSFPVVGSRTWSGNCTLRWEAHPTD